MVVGILIAFCLLWAWFAQTIGLAAIIGAFVAGLILDGIIFVILNNLSGIPIY